MTVLSAWLGARLLAGMVGSMPVPAPLAVVVDAAVLDGDALAARIVAGLEPLVHLLPATPGAAASIRVTGDLLDFRVSLALGPDGARTWSWCPCTHAELVTHVQRRLAHALRLATACPPAPAPPLASEPAPASPPPRLPVHARAPSRSGRVGVALVGTGGLALGTGLGVMMAAQGLDDEQWAPRADLRPLGVAAIVVGASALATGSLLLLLDRRLARAHRRAAHP